MSHVRWQARRVMKAEPSFCPVILEPALERRAALWSPAKRRFVARKFQRWARQLIISAAVMDRRAAPAPPPRLKALPRRKLTLN